MPLFEENKIQPNSVKSAEENKSNSLTTTIDQLLPFAPLVFEQLTSQKVLPITGTMAEIQSALTNLQTNLATVIQNQQVLAQKLVNLEANANQ